jgi:hypothetical protein
MPRYYFYRMTTDNGGAPCCRDGLWSLAICKPRIRRSAQKEDFVLGLAGNGIDPDNGLIHIARVTNKLPDGAYYDSKSAYRDRPDCIYERTVHGYTQRRNKFHGASDMDRDLGAKGEHADVLLSADYRYFGRERLNLDWSQYPKLRARLVSLTQGERVNHTPEVLNEILRLVDAAFSTKKRANVHPTHSDGCRCNTDDDEEEGVCGGGDAHA